MAKGSKKKLSVVEDAGEQPAEQSANEAINPFDNPEAALEEGSASHLAVLEGNQVEEPEEDSFEAAGSHQELREKIKTLMRSADDLYWDLASSLATVANEKLYKSWGYKSFEAYVNEECRIDKRKGQYFVQIHNYFSSNLRSILVNDHDTYEHYVEAAKRMGWVKARILAKEQVVTEANAQALLEKISSCTVRELEDICAVAANQMEAEDQEKRTEENIDKMVRLTFQCTLAQKEDIEKAIEHAKSIIGKAEVTRSSALSWAARSYLDFDIVARGGKADLPAHLGAAERTFDVSLVAIDAGAGKIVYGEASLQKLADHASAPN